MAPNSPELDLVDYKIWGVMQLRVYEMQIHNVDERIQRLVDVWSGLQQSVVDTTVSEWRKRLYRHVFARKEDTSNICCFNNGMKLSIDSLCTLCFSSS